MKLFNISWMAILLSGTAVAAQSTSIVPLTTKIDVSKLGPQVADRVPDFNLADQNGKTQTLESIMGPKGAMLVFIRSADW
jgi:hypothetical protein